MVTCLNSYRESTDKDHSARKSAPKANTAEVITLRTESHKKAKARARLLKAASKIHW